MCSKNVRLFQPGSTSRPFTFNPLDLEGIPEEHRKTYIRQIIDFFLDCYLADLNLLTVHGVEFLLLRGVDELLEKKETITFHDLNDWLCRFKGKYRETDWKTSALDLLYKLTSGPLGKVMCQSDRSIAQLARQRTILELHNTGSARDKSFLIRTLLLRLYYHFQQQDATHIWKSLREPRWMHALIHSGERMIDVWKRNYQPVTFYYRSFETVVLYLKSLPAERKTPVFLKHLRRNLEMSPSFRELANKNEYERRMLAKIDKQVNGAPKAEKENRMVRIHTVQISVAQQLGLVEDPRYLDTTVKSGDPVFAPTWEIVMASQQGKMSDEEYTIEYYDMMRRSYRDNRSRWDEVLGMEEVFLACYCRADSFCHRYLLKDILVKCGAEYVGEIRDEEDGRNRRIRPAEL